MKKNSMSEHFKERFGGNVEEFSLTPPLPSSLNLELNNTCNQKCFFCPFHGEYAKHKVKNAVMDKERAKTILAHAANVGIGRKELGLYLAGEAFLYKDLAEIIAYAKDLGFPYIFLTSNGVLADLEKMKRLIDAGLDSIRFSINAADRETYRIYHGTDHFDVVKENIKRLNDYIKDNDKNIITSISCVLTKETLGTKERFSKEFSEYVDEIVFFPLSLSRMVDDTSIKAKYAIQSMEEAEIDPEYVCPLLFNTMYINAEEWVVPCCEAYDTMFAFGKLDDSCNFEEIWNNKLYQWYRSIFVNKEPDNGTICHNCQLRRGGLESQILLDD